MEARMRDEATLAVRRLNISEGSLPPGLVLFDPGWHAGIIGLVASRMKERLNRPVVAFAPAGEDELRGSARSVEGVHVRDALEAIATRHPELIERFGGHAMAAGLTLRPGMLSRFAEAFAEEVGRQLTPEQMQGVLVTDGELAAAEITLETARALESGGPWGQGFPEPLFEGEFEIVDTRLVGERHLKLWVRPTPASHPVEAIAFGHCQCRRQNFRTDMNMCRQIGVAHRDGGNQIAVQQSGTEERQSLGRTDDRRFAGTAGGARKLRIWRGLVAEVSCERT